MRAWTIALEICLLFLAGVVGAEQSAWEQVWRSETAAAGLTMAGQVKTMTATDGRSLSATAEVRAAHGKVRLDYSANGRQWSLIDDGKRLLQLHSREKMVQVRERPPLAIDRGLAERNYVAKAIGEATVAGRKAGVIEIAPREGGPVVQRLWLDRETGFALKRERYNAESRLVSGTEYLEIGFRKAVDASVFEAPAGWRFEGPAPVAPKLSMAELSKRMRFEVRSPSYLPRGYELLGGYEQHWGRHERGSAELRYTDGLRMLSVFERPRTGEEERGRGRREREHRRNRSGGRHGRGPEAELTVNDRGTEKVLRYHGRELVVIVVGDLTADELVRIGKSVE